MAAPRPASIFRVLRKEVGEALRDRALVLQLLILPVFLYPVMGFGAYQVFSMMRGIQEKEVHTVWVDADLPAALRDRIASQERLRVVEMPARLNSARQAATVDSLRQSRAALLEAEGDVAAPQAALSYWRAAAKDSLRIYWDSSSDRSQDVRERLMAGIEAHRDSLRREEGRLVGLADVEFDLFATEEVRTASAQQMGRYILSMMLPIFLMMMLAQGAYYSALDTVVGERERGTLETLFSAPLAKSEIMIGKFLYVTISSLVTFLLNLLSLVFFVGYVFKLLKLPVQLSFTIPFSTIAILSLAALLAGATLAALMMLVLLPAKHYREGQSALTPLYMLAGFSSFAVIGTKLDYGLVYALIPFVNVSALAKTAIGGELSLRFAAVTFAVLFVLAVISIAVASKLASRESALFDPDISLKRLFREAFRS